MSTVSFGESALFWWRRKDETDERNTMLADDTSTLRRATAARLGIITETVQGAIWELASVRLNPGGCGTRLSVCEIRFYFSIWWRRDVWLACRRLHPSITLHPDNVRRFFPLHLHCHHPNWCFFYSQIWAAVSFARRRREDFPYYDSGWRCHVSLKILSWTRLSFPAWQLRGDSFPPVIFLLDLFTVFPQNKLAQKETDQDTRSARPVFKSIYWFVFDTQVVMSRSGQNFWLGLKNPNEPEPVWWCSEPF